MLSIYFGNIDENSKYYDALEMNPEAYFDSSYDPRWLDDKFIRNIIKDIDKTDVISQNLMIGPIGPIPPDMLSGGVKTLILIDKVDRYIFNATYCGDNCARWLLKIGEDKDRLVRLSYYMYFEEPFTIRIENNGKIVHTRKELYSYINDWME